MRIVSLVPAATEIAFALGLGEEVAGVSDQCDWPPEAREKPVVLRSTASLRGLTPAEIDRVISTSAQAAVERYVLDEALLQKLAPDLVLVQDLCHVCAASGADVASVINSLSPAPSLLTFAPRTLTDILDNIRMLGAATARESEADVLVSGLRARINRVRSATQSLRRHRVTYIEWTDPLYCAGHWIPEMIELAGGFDPLGRKGEHSLRIEWNDLRAADPAVIVIGPCGCTVAEAHEHATALASHPQWKELRAVRDGQTHVVDGNAFFARPGPRVVDGIELLHSILTARAALMV